MWKVLEGSGRTVFGANLSGKPPAARLQLKQAAASPAGRCITIKPPP